MSLTASRGRGKSAALGLAVAAAIAFDYSNIFVTSPSPENLNTFFQFVFKGEYLTLSVVVNGASHFIISYLILSPLSIYSFISLLTTFF